MTAGFKKGKKFIPTGVQKGYNVKLRKQDIMKNPQLVTLKNGRHAVKGIGSDGTMIFRFVKENL